MDVLDEANAFLAEIEVAWATEPPEASTFYVVMEPLSSTAREQHGPERSCGSPLLYWECPGGFELDVRAHLSSSDGSVDPTEFVGTLARTEEGTLHALRVYLRASASELPGTWHMLPLVPEVQPSSGFSIAADWAPDVPQVRLSLFAGGIVLAESSP